MRHFRRLANGKVGAHMGIFMQWEYLRQDEGRGSSDIFILLGWLFCHRKVNSSEVLLAKPERISRPLPSPHSPKAAPELICSRQSYHLLRAATTHCESFLGCVYHKYPPSVTSTLGSDHLRGHNPLLRVSVDGKVRKISPCFSTINLAKPISRLMPQCSDMIMARRLLRRD